jgi:UDP-N-acetyl-D-glucosamine dehydrogenase
VSERLVVVGLGYVGLPMALRAAESGLQVTGLDTNPQLVDSLNGGSSHIDDVGDSELAAALALGFRATSDMTCLDEADAVIVCVPTPLAEGGGPDLGAVESAARAIADHVSAGALVVLESTTYPGTTEEVFARLVTGDRLTLGEDVFVAFSPERIDPGNADFNVKNTPKVVGGLTSECSRRAVELYQQFIDVVVPAKGAREAEMAKLIENTFRHVNIALMNEMVRFCDELDIDLWNAIECAETKPFGYMAFRPGPGVGGHCIPVDPSYLSHRVKAKLGYAFRMVELAEEINLAAPAYVAGRVWRLLNADHIAINGAKVLLAGVTYKANISDQRESPAVPLAKHLLAWGADLSFHDPFVARWTARPGDEDELASAADNLYSAAAESDVVVLVQAHREFDLERLTDSSRRLLDTRGVVGEAGNVFRL